MDAYLSNSRIEGLIQFSLHKVQKIPGVVFIYVSFMILQISIVAFILFFLVYFMLI